MKTKLIITEKKNISDVVAKALSELGENESRSSELHRDVFQVTSKQDHNTRQCYVAKQGLKGKEYFYFCQRDCENCKFHAAHVDKKNTGRASAVRKNLENNIGRDGTIIEDVSYFVIEKKNTRYIIADTSGNPFSFYNTSKTWMERTVLNSQSFEDLESKLQHRAQTDARKRSSYLARNFLFNSLLAKERLPCDTSTKRKGSNITIDEIIGATDFDIAGSYIFQSVLEATNEFREKMNKEPLKADISRIRTDDISREGIQAQINSPEEMDWRNVYAGKLRTMFDFVYGMTLTNQFNHIKNKEHKNSSVNFSIGRNMFLGLKEVLKEELRISEKEEQKCTYIMFDSARTEKEIEDKIRTGDYTAIQTHEKKQGVSVADFLKRCKEANIGTHTTRYVLPERLEDTRVIDIEDGIIHSTSYGQKYFFELAQHIDNPNKRFSITAWNHVLSTVIDNWRIDNKESYSTISEDQIKDKYYAIMNDFLKDFKSHLRDLRGNYSNTIDNLIEAYNSSEKNSKEKKETRKVKVVYKKSRRKSEDKFDNTIKLKGNTSVISEREVNKMFSDDNKPLPTSPSIIERKIEQKFEKKKIDENYIRLMCAIPRGTAFCIDGNYNIENLLGISDGKQVVYKTEGHIDLKNIQASEYDFFSSDSGFSEETNSAHEPLFASKVEPSAITNEHSLKLMKEYNLPWISTYNKEEGACTGNPEVSGMTISGKHFKRNEHYTQGKVHNFESLLTTMFEKYGFPFQKTAELVEELYLNSSR